MIIGVPKEIKKNENRVAATPMNVSELVKNGNKVLVESDAGIESGFLNKHYEEVGAIIIDHPADVWKADMVIKVKEPLEEEYKYFYDGLIIFTYLHLANDQNLADALIESNVSAISYETITVDGKLPLLKPMSEIAGRLAVLVGSQFLQHKYDGAGILLSGVPGVRRGHVVIIGGGVAGSNAAKIAIGLGAAVTVLDIDQERLAELDDSYGSKIDTLMSNSYNIARSVKEADLLIGSVLVPGSKAPVLVSEEMIKTMKEGSVVIDIAVDQGGNFETTDRTTTHEDPIYIKHGISHYTVANIPGAVPRTSTTSLTNVTMKYVNEIANLGLEEAFRQNEALAHGSNVYKGHITNKGVASAFEYSYKNVKELL